MSLHYHQSSLKLIGQEAKFPPETSALLRNVESDLGCALPASVREWYALKDAATILKKYSNADHPVPLKDLGLTGSDSCDAVDVTAKGERFLTFLIENQGVCVWAFELDQAEDPTVVVRWNEPGAVWQLAADRFSDFIYTWLWDHHHRRECGIQAIGSPLAQTDLGFLRTRYSEMLSTASWPEVRQYRFHTQNQWLLLWNGASQADWYLGADSPSNLFDFALTVWQHIGLPDWVVDCLPEGSQVDDIADRLKAKLG